MSNLTCPLGECEGLPHLISLDGGLKHIKPFMMPDLQKIGWMKVDNPKRNYYPEYDTTNPNYSNEEIPAQDSDTLPVVKL